MPSTATDARDLLIASVLSNDPVLYIDDRWLYEETEPETPVTELMLTDQKPKIVQTGDDITIVASGQPTELKTSYSKIKFKGISTELIDLRVLNPLDVTVVCRFGS